MKGPQDQNLLGSLISWDSEAEAQEFFDIFIEFIQTQTGAEWESVGGSETIRVVDLPDQSIYIALDIAETLLIFAPDPAVLESARAVVEGS